MKKKKLPPSLIKSSLNYSVKEASATATMEGLGNNFISPFAIAMQASPSQIGLLTAIPHLIAPFSQLHANQLIKKISRKSLVLKSVLLQSILWLPIAAIPFILSGSLRVWALIILFTICFTSGSFLSPAWHSWIGDLVKKKSRGEFFGKRNRRAVFFLLASSLLAGWFLKIFSKEKLFYNYDFILIGFTILFLLAFIVRLLSRHFINKQYEPDFKYDKKSYFSIFSFIKKSTKTNFGNFTLYHGLLRIATAIAGPFFALYMLRDLNFTYPMYISMTIASSSASMLFHPIWGKIADRYGSVKIIKFCSIILSISPALWLISSNWFYLLFVNALGGLSWAGFGVSSGNFIFENVRREKRAFGVAYFNIFIGVGIFLGAAISGLVIPFIPIKIFGNVLLTIFLASAILRLLLTLIFYPRIKEKRKVEEKPILEIIGSDVMKGAVEDIFVTVNNALPRRIAIKDALEFRKRFLERRISRLENKVKNLKTIKEKLKKT